MIKEKLQKIDPIVDYGLGKFDSRKVWDCIIYNKQSTKISGNQITDYYKVIIVREDMIPEGIVQEVIGKLKELGLKPTEAQAEYVYVFKSKDIVVESCFLEFYKARKGC